MFWHVRAGCTVNTPNAFCLSMSVALAQPPRVPLAYNYFALFESGTGVEPVEEVLQTPTLTAWLTRHVKHFVNPKIVQ